MKIHYRASRISGTTACGRVIPWGWRGNAMLGKAHDTATPQPATCRACLRTRGEIAERDRS